MTSDRLANFSPVILSYPYPEVVIVSKSINPSALFIIFNESIIFLIGTPGEIRTPDPLVRSQVLYPAELRAHSLIKIIIEILETYFLILNYINQTYKIFISIEHLIEVKHNRLIEKT